MCRIEKEMEEVCVTSIHHVMVIGQWYVTTGAGNNSWQFSWFLNIPLSKKYCLYFANKVLKICQHFCLLITFKTSRFEIQFHHISCWLITNVVCLIKVNIFANLFIRKKKKPREHRVLLSWRRWESIPNLPGDNVSFYQLS